MQITKAFRLSLTSKLIEFPERMRGGMLEKWLEYWKTVFNDYKSVFLDVRQDIQDHPKRATLIGALLFGFGYLLKTNPSEEGFIEQMINSSNLISRVPRNLHNNRSYEHVNYIFKLHNQQLLRYQSFGLFSIIYLEDYGKQNSIYASQCKFLYPSWKSYITERIIDIGFIEDYQILKRKMIDYDINADMYTGA